jgi:hypothetical protein
MYGAGGGQGEARPRQQDPSDRAGHIRLPALREGQFDPVEPGAPQGTIVNLGQAAVFPATPEGLPASERSPRR